MNKPEDVPETKRHPSIVTLVFIIEPVPKGRPRYSRKSGASFTPKRTITYENKLREDAILQWGGEESDFPIYHRKVPLAVDFDFIFPRPKMASRKKDPFGQLWRPSLPDGDNLEKAVMDSLNGIVWEDDAQIVDARWRKMYADKRSGRDGKPFNPVNTEGRICVRIRPAPDLPIQRTCDWHGHDRLLNEHGPGCLLIEEQDSSEK